MVTFFVCLVLLIVGFFTYSKLVEKISSASTTVPPLLWLTPTVWTTYP